MANATKMHGPRSSGGTVWASVTCAAAGPAQNMMGHVAGRHIGYIAKLQFEWNTAIPVLWRPSQNGTNPNVAHCYTQAKHPMLPH